MATVALLWACPPAAQEAAPTSDPRPTGPEAKREAEPKAETKAEATAASYVAAERCQGCHDAEWQAWKGSDHDLALQEPSDDTVLARFEGTFEGDDGTTRFFRRDGSFGFRAPGPAGKTEDFRVEYVFGVDPLQQYLVRLPGGRLQSHSVVWDVEKGRWFDLYPDDTRLPGDPYHWTGRMQGWNAMCADCHSTGVRRGYDDETDTYETTFEDEDVGCQACHGPGSRHVAWAESEPRPDSIRMGLTVQTSGRSAQEEVQACAPCHARRSRLTVDAEPGGRFFDHYRPAWLREGLYHPDGQIQEEVYVYGSFIQSKMYAAGVRCGDCHSPHGLQASAADATCVRCHNTDPPDRFSGLAARAKRYDGPGHHHHPEGGVACVDCHMVSQNYMVIDGRRDHSFRIPRPDLASATGAPDACSGCHTDQTAAWAAAQVETWFGPRPEHFGPVFAAAREGTASLQALAPWATDPRIPAIVRVTAIHHLQDLGPRAWGVLNPLTEDAHPWVRAAAVTGLQGMPGDVLVQTAGHLLEDPIRIVRQEAARTLLPARSALGLKRRQRLDAISRELEATLRSEADLPSGSLSLGLHLAALGRFDEAEAAYRTALERDPDFTPARFNLGNLLNALGKNEEAKQVFREAVRRSPENGELRYSLGLLLAEMQKFDEAARELGEAARLLPARTRVAYNHALALQRAGRAKDAVAVFEGLVKQEPENPDFVYALLNLHAQQSRWAQALPLAERLVELVPGADGPRRILEDVRSRLAF